MFQKFSGSEKVYGQRGGVSKFSVEKNFSHSAEYFVGQPCCSVFQKLSGSENFINKGGGGVSRFSVEKFFSHSAEKIRRATLLCSSQKLSSSEKLYG